MPHQDVVLKAIEPQHVVSIREIIPSPISVGTLLNEGFSALGRKGIQPSAAPQAIYHDEEFKLEQMDVEVVIPVATSVTQDILLGDGRKFAVRELAAVASAASIIHMGSYDGLTDTYQTLGKWIEANGYRIAGASREIYLKPARSDNQPIVEVQWPVEKVSAS